MTQRVTLYGLLAIVATSAAILSFDALRDLALLCGFTTELAWLLPVAIDAGAAAGSLVWLGRRASDGARRYARTLALALLGTSVAANALSHGLAADHLAPAWWMVVVVSAVAPAILGAVIHLGVLVGRVPSTQVTTGSPAVLQSAASLATAPGEAGGAPGETWEAKRDRLLLAKAGRKRLMAELGITEHAARKLLEARATEVETRGEELA